MVLVESKARKCAFLREVARSLALGGVEVANTRFETLRSRPDLAGQVDVVSLRAVRADHTLWTVVSTLLKHGGTALWFGGSDQQWERGGPDLVHGLAFASSRVLIPATSESSASHLAVLQKTS